MSPKSDVTFNDDNFYKKNVSEILLSIHQNVLGSKEETTSIYNMETELNKLNLYSLLARLIIMQKNELDTISDFLNEKYKFLSSIFENVFYNDANKELFLSEFSKVQRIYFTLSKFARICKYKKSIVRINTDLYINELDESMKNFSEFYDQKFIYSGDVIDTKSVCT
jgi:hypothetical protein